MRGLRRYSDFRDRKDGEVLSLPWLRLDCYATFWKDMSDLYLGYRGDPGLLAAYDGFCNLINFPVGLPIKTDPRTAFAVLLAARRNELIASSLLVIRACKKAREDI